MKDELQGKLVLVHPDLTNDPAGKQNEIGVIKTSDLEQDDVFVSFDNGELSLYATDALLILKPANEIYDKIASIELKLDFPDLKALNWINLLQRYGSSNQLRNAMEQAKQHPGIHSLCLITLREALEINQSQNRSR